MYRYAIVLVGLVGLALAHNEVMTALVSQNLFAKAYGGTNGEWAYSIIQKSDMGLVVAGQTASFDAESLDLLVIKLNLDGLPVWARTYGGARNEWANSIIQTADGGLALTGQTTSFSVGGLDFLVIKLSSDGNLEWARTYGGTKGEWSYSIIQTSDGGYALTGLTWSFGSGNDDFLVIKLSSDGNLEWARTYGGTSYDNAWSIIQTGDNGFVVTGYTESFGAGNGDILVLKLASDGSLSWARTFGGTGQDWSRSIIQTTDGGFAVAGRTPSFGAGDSDFFVLKLSSDGNLEWARTYGGTSSDYPYSIFQTSDGGLTVVGTTYSFGVGERDCLILKLGSDGSLEWASSFGGTGEEWGHSVIQTSDGALAIAGRTQSFGAGGSDFFVLKLGLDGNYADCVQDCSPIEMGVSPSASDPYLTTTSPLPNTSSPDLTVTTPDPAISEICPTVGINESDLSGPKPTITCSHVPGGALFVSPGEIPIKIYSADGRLAYSGNLQKGENRINLETGVYLWNAGNQKGKLAIR